MPSMQRVALYMCMVPKISKLGPLQYSRCINRHCHMPIVYNLVSLIPPPHKNANNVREHPLTSGTKYALRIV